MISINATIYDQTGRIVRLISATRDVVQLNLQPGQSYIEGTGRTSDQYVKNGEIVDMPPKPADFYVFDYINESWVADTDLADTQARAKREQLLADVDKINPMWWNAMTPEQQQAWSDYRQALLDITTQPGYPTDITWPTKP